MRLTGIVLHNPVLGVELVTTEVDEDGGTRLVADYEIEPHRPRDEFRHVHRTWTEEFQILAGEARYEVGGEERPARAGEVAELPANVPHLHPWNAGDGLMRMRQIATLDPPDPEALRYVGYGIATLYGTVAEGRHDAKGRPPLMQVASTLRSFQRYGIFLDKPAVPVQRLLFGLLAAIGWLGGVRPYYQRHLLQATGAAPRRRAAAG